VADDVNGDEVGTLEIELADDIAAHQLAAFLTVTDKVYFDSLWLQRAEEAPGGVFPDNYSPSEAEELWINRLEIGTPNLVELIGNLNALGEVAQYLAAFLATATTATLTAKAYGDLTLKQAKANLINAKAERLRAQGKITQTALEHKMKDPDSDQLSAMGAAIAPQPPPQPPPQPRPAPARKEDAAIRAELKAINRLDLLPLLRAHSVARRALERGIGKDSDAAALQNAYVQIRDALGSDEVAEALLVRVSKRE
jgi:hypothetical protein